MRVQGRCSAETARTVLFGLGLTLFCAPVQAFSVHSGALSLHTHNYPGISPLLKASIPVLAASGLPRRASVASIRASVTDSVEIEREQAKELLLATISKGPKNGVDASTEERAEVDRKLASLVALNPTSEPAYALLRPPYDFFDGTFDLIYTNTSGGSSGKIGPFVGDVSQTFQGIRDNDAMGFSRRGIFSNDVQVGPAKIGLRARCESKSETKLNIVFEETAVSLFGFIVQKKEFEVGGKGTRGTWDIKYMDEDLRVLRTNAGNVVILQRGQPEGGESWMDRQRRLGAAPL